MSIEEKMNHLAKALNKVVTADSVHEGRICLTGEQWLSFMAIVKGKEKVLKERKPYINPDRAILIGEYLSSITSKEFQANMCEIEPWIFREAERLNGFKWSATFDSSTFFNSMFCLN